MFTYQSTTPAIKMEMKEIKKEVKDIAFVEVDSHDVHQLCTACLCATRTTHTLGDVTLKQHYMNILTETQQVEEDEPILQSLRLCWECVAHLKRSVRFREQVQDSYRLLQTIHAKENLAEFLQTSMTRPARLSTCCAYSTDISPQDDDTQLMAADEDHDDKSAAMVYLEINMGVSTNSEDQDESVDTDGLTGKRAEGAKHCVTTTNTTNSTDVETTCQSEGVFSCDGCSKRFPSKAALDRHIAIYPHNTKTGPFPCDVCNKAFSTKGKLIRHQKMHSVKPFQCKVCSKAFHTISILFMHSKRVHTVAKPFKCEECPKSFAQKGTLSRHRRTHIGGKPFQCDVCRKSFAYKRTMKAHFRAHNGQKPFQCEVCGKLFLQRVNLTGHIRSHTGEKPFKCKECGKPFSQSSHLKTHMRTHTGEKPFLCKVCNKSFSLNKSLTCHIRTHTGEKPFQCEVCQKQFSLRKTWKRHITTHTGERNFQCEVCPRQFSQIKSLTSHKKTHTGEKSF